MTLRHVIEDINENPHRERDFYEYPALYDFYHSRMLDRDRQVNLLERYQPDDANRVLEFGCGTGPLLTRIEDEYEEVLGVDADERMLESARKHVSEADVLEADFTEWSAADDGRVFDVAALLGGLLHLTDNRDVESFAKNVYESLREGGTFVTFFQPFTDDVDNGSTDTQTVESERFSVERRSTTALTSADGHYTTTYVFTIRDTVRETEAKMGSVFHGRFHDPDALADTFDAAGFSDVEVIDSDGTTIFHAVK
ncbi:class I SAM-dependent methyltransferase [Halogeometricum borinquense]|uniref:Class I SAM-dependent methyltransferase n=1 Tax=Halogeometricum borinquense TaxID=60847 RepID=A0A482TQR1_9EURY|nr:class I SAM-dependent methyltransferase [Halogeometricum borinquense]RYJ15245.1 class I SAM-dependent methyltransferase [Halogeometricum borinquense]